MGMFKKKKNEHNDFLDSMPSATGLGGDTNIPKLPEEKSGFPSYSSELGSIKKEVSKSIPSANNKPTQNIIPERPKQQPMSVDHRMPSKPVFVKIDDYKEAIESLEAIKGLTNQAGEILDQLTRIRNEEDRELNKWQTDIQKIKERLLVIDKRLFEQ